MQAVGDPSEVKVGPRLQSGCDVGAFEYGSLAFADGFELWNWKRSEVVP